MTDDATNLDVPTGTDEHSPPAAEPATKEAARYRRQLRDVEAQRDTLAANVESLQRAEVLRQVAERGVQRPEAIFAAGVTLADVLAEDGTVDAVLVNAATDRAVGALGLAVAGPPSLDGGVRTPPPKPAPTWADAISGSRRS